MGAAAALAVSGLAACGGQTATTTASASTASATTGFADGTYTGDAVAIKWGDVQVQAVIEGGKIASVEFLTYPTDRESQQINSQAGPTLIQEAIEAQSATVQVISGATFTSLAFMRSLESALSQAS
jgi:uncharacterized protein with FMN-binding domain